MSLRAYDRLTNKVRQLLAESGILLVRVSSDDAGLATDATLQEVRGISQQTRDLLEQTRDLVEATRALVEQTRDLVQQTRDRLPPALGDDGGLLIEPTQADVVSQSAVFEATRVIYAGPFRLRYLRVFSSLSGVVALFNKTTDPATNDVAKGSAIWSITGGESITVPLPSDGEDFATGCAVAFCSSFTSAGTVADVTVGQSKALFYAEGDPL